MTREQAAREAKKRWGKRAHIRADEKLSSPEKRAAAKTQTDALKARRDAIDKEIAERLAALDWYQALKAERRDVSQRLDNVRWETHYYRFGVGELFVGFHVHGEGDTWEQAFAAADARKAGA
jgi:seryl-tRNA synthetase